MSEEDNEVEMIMLDMRDDCDNCKKRDRIYAYYIDQMEEARHRAFRWGLAIGAVTTAVAVLIMRAIQ